jgi:hypothetical protein
MKKPLSKVMLSLGLCAGLSLMAGNARAEGWSVGGSLNPVVIVFDFVGGAVFGATAQVGYQTKDGFTTRFSANISAIGVDFYQQSVAQSGDRGVYWGAGVTYNPTILASSLSTSVLTPLGIKGIIGYEFGSSASAWNVFLEYSPVLHVGCLLSCSNDGLNALGALGVAISGFVNLQLGLNYRF